MFVIVGLLCILFVLWNPKFIPATTHVVPKKDLDLISGLIPDPNDLSDPSTYDARAFLDVMIMEDWDEMEGEGPSTF
jgi:hypothetical protein